MILTLASDLCLARVAAVLRARPVVDPRAAGVHGAMLRFAAAEGLLRDGRPTAKLALPRPYAERLVMDATWRADPVAFAWLVRALDGLEDTLRGSRLAEDVLFPGGDFDLARRLYAESPLFSGYAKLAFAALTGAREVLELGAGTGATGVLEHASVARYVFTDVSPRLVAARPADPRETARVLDIDQDWDVDPVDAVVAVNVLHLAADPLAVLRRARRSLRPGGAVVLGEISPPGGPFPLVELTFGQLPSFWRHRPEGPLRAPADWRALLSAAGFGPPTFTPHRVDGVELGGVFVAHLEVG